MPTTTLVASGSTFAYQFRPGKNYADRRHMSAGRDTNGSLSYMLVSFEQQHLGLPLGATITEASLLLTVVKSQQASPPMIYDVIRIQSNWSPTSVTWGSLPVDDPTPRATFSAVDTGPLTVGITGLAQDWLTGKYAQLGLLIKGNGNPEHGNYLQTATLNSPDSDSWPRLAINYSLPSATNMPTFTDNHVALVVPPAGSVKHSQEVALNCINTVIVTNNGPDAVSAQLEVSADDINYVTSSSQKLIASGETALLVSDVFARYLQLSIGDQAVSGAVVDVYFQGRIGG